MIIGSKKEVGKLVAKCCRSHKKSVLEQDSLQINLNSTRNYLNEHLSTNVKNAKNILRSIGIIVLGFLAYMK